MDNKLEGTIPSKEGEIPFIDAIIRIARNVEDKIFLEKIIESGNIVAFDYQKITSEMIDDMWNLSKGTWEDLCTFVYTFESRQVSKEELKVADWLYYLIDDVTKIDTEDKNILDIYQRDPEVVEFEENFRFPAIWELKSYEKNEWFQLGEEIGHDVAMLWELENDNGLPLNESHYENVKRNQPCTLPCCIKSKAKSKIKPPKIDVSKPIGTCWMCNKSIYPDQPRKFCQDKQSYQHITFGWGQCIKE